MRFDPNTTGINQINDNINFKTFFDCKPENFTYNYHGELEQLYSGKYSKDELRLKSCFYEIDIQPLEDQNQILVAFLRNIRFFDYNTEFFLIQVNGFNINKNIWITFKLIFEQTPNGLTHTSYELCTLSIFNEMKIFMNFKFEIESIIRLIVLIVIVFYTFFSILDIIRKFLKNPREYVSGIWNFFEVIKVLMYFISIVIRIYIYITIFDIIGEQNKEKFIDTDDVCHLSQTLLLIEILMACFTLFYFLQYMDKNIFEPISRTIIDSWKNILVFLFSFISSLFGFSFFSFFIYGTRITSECDI